MIGPYNVRLLAVEWESKGPLHEGVVTPLVTIAGLSLGEYTALTAAGTPGPQPPKKLRDPKLGPFPLKALNPWPLASKREHRRGPAPRVRAFLM